MRYILIFLLLPFFAQAQQKIPGHFVGTEEVISTIVSDGDTTSAGISGKTVFSSTVQDIIEDSDLNLRQSNLSVDIAYGNNVLFSFGGTSITSGGVLNIQGWEINILPEGRIIIEKEWNGHRYGMSILDNDGGYTAYKYDTTNHMDVMVLAINEHSMYLEVIDSIYNDNPFITKGIRFPQGTDQPLSFHNGDNFIELTRTGLRVNGFEALNDTIPAGARPIVENGVVIDWVY